MNYKAEEYTIAHLYTEVLITLFYSNIGELKWACG